MEEGFSDAELRSSAKEINHYSVGPNPVSGILRVNYEISIDNLVSLYTTEGLLLHSVRIDKAGNDVNLEMSQNPNGMYYLIIRDENNEELNYFEKIIKQ